jgi:peptide/nickel transport system substrate-binding protein
MVGVRLATTSRGAILLIAALLVAGCAPSQPDAGPPRVSSADDATPRPGQAGGAMIVAATGDAVSFHPFKVSDSPSRGYQGLVYAGGLITHDPHNPENFIPWLAESWTVSDNRLTFTFHLRPDLRWSDGQPITSADFKWTFDQAIKPENQYPYASNFEPIVAYEAPDPRTVEVTLKEPSAVGLDNADVIGPLPKHVWENLDWNDAGQNPEIMAPTVVSGPFKLKEWQRDHHATFVANDLYFKGRPKLDSYTVQILPSQAIAFEKLRAGEVDRAEFDPADIDRARHLDNVTVYEWWPAAATWNYLGFNLRKPYLQDVKVRRAMAYAIDRQLIVDKIMYGLGGPIYSAYPTSCWCYNPDVPHYDYDPERSRQLLAEAGWLPGPDGIVTKDGERLRLRMIYGPNTSKVRERIATVAQEEFRKIGVEVELQGLEWGTFLQTVHAPPFDWDMTVLGWTSTVDPHWMYQIWSEKNIPKLNSVGYVNKRVEDLFQDGVREFNPEQRKPAYQEIQKILADDLPYVFLTMSKGYTGINNRIGGVEVTALGVGQNIEQWYVK